MDILKGCDYMKLIADEYNDSGEGYYTIRFSKKEIDIDAGTYMEFWYKKTDDGYENTFLVVGHDSYEGGEYIDTHTVINCNYHELESYIKYYISSKLPSWQEKIRKIRKTRKTRRKGKLRPGPGSRLRGGNQPDQPDPPESHDQYPADSQRFPEEHLLPVL